MRSVREGYKMTEVGEIPNEWNVMKLSEVTEIVMGQSPDSSSYNDIGDGVAFFQGKTEFGRINPIVKKWCNNPTKISKPLDILISVRAPVGDVNINNIEACIGRGLAAIRQTDKSNYKYLYYAIQKYNNQLQRASQGSTFEAINSNDLKGLKLPMPLINEQEKIASILSTVDEQIDNVDALIEKNKELKKGLMQTLLTKGIGHTKFKKTEIGEIPNEWSIKTIGEVVKLIKSGLSRSLKDEDIGIPCIRSNNINNYNFDKSDLKYWFLEDNKGANINEYILADGDILVNFINSLAQIGKTCLYKDIGRPVIYTTNIFRMNLNEQIMLNKYFYYISQTEIYNNEIKLITKPAVNQASFTVADFKIIKIAIPPINEQIKIVSILSEIDKKIEEYENKKQRLEKIKKGLMQKLLIGKIRI